MYSIAKPQINVVDHFENCASGTNIVDLRSRLLNSTDEITIAASKYDAAGTIGRLYSVQKSTGLAATDEELRLMYKRTMVPKKAKGRAVYDSLMHGARGMICPFCSQRVASTLDHYLPKDAFPDLAIVPINLVPACHNCNDRKRNLKPSCPSDQFIHPYYDQLPNGKWLFASITYKTQIPAVSFEALPPGGWEPSLSARVQYQFGKLDLANLYATHAAVEVVNIRYQLNRMLGAGGVLAVREWLTEAAASRTIAYPNSWQAATYEALAASARFCNGEFG